MVPAYLELLETTLQPAGAQPALLPLPELDEGPHLSYAIQGFLFSAMAIGGWFLAVRRSSSAAWPATGGPRPTGAAGTRGARYTTA